MIHCALCFHIRGEFYKNTYITMLSCFMNTQSRLHMHLVTDQTAEPYRDLFTGLCREYGHEVTFYPSPEMPADVLALFPDDILAAAYTSASQYRMFLHEVLPPEVEKVIYFDCDMVFEKDVAELDAMELGDAYLLATHDPERKWSLHKRNYYLKKLDIREDRYFNSGLLVMNLKKLREDSAGGNVFMEYYRKLAPLAPTLSYPIYDQDLLNAMLSRDEHKLTLIAIDYNYELCQHKRRFLPLEKLTDKIFHLAAVKPWEKFAPALLIYWKYYLLSPWKHELVNQLSRRFVDPRDKVLRQTMLFWQNPKNFNWLWKILRPFINIVD